MGTKRVEWNPTRSDQRYQLRLGLYGENCSKEYMDKWWLLYFLAEWTDDFFFLVCAGCGWPSFGVLANTKAHQVFEGESVIADQTVNKGTNWQLEARKGHKQGKTVRHNGVEVAREERLLAFSWSYGCWRRVLSERVMGRQNSPLRIPPFALAFLNR